MTASTPVASTPLPEAQARSLGARLRQEPEQISARLQQFAAPALVGQHVQLRDRGGRVEIVAERVEHWLGDRFRAGAASPIDLVEAQTFARASSSARTVQSIGWR